MTRHPHRHVIPRRRRLPMSWLVGTLAVFAAAGGLWAGIAHIYGADPAQTVLASGALLPVTAPAPHTVVIPAPPPGPSVSVAPVVDAAVSVPLPAATRMVPVVDGPPVRVADPVTVTTPPASPAPVVVPSRVVQAEPPAPRHVERAAAPSPQVEGRKDSDVPDRQNGHTPPPTSSPQPSPPPPASTPCPPPSSTPPATSTPPAASTPPVTPVPAPPPTHHGGHHDPGKGHGGHGGHRHAHSNTVSGGRA